MVREDLVDIDDGPDDGPDNGSCSLNGSTEHVITGHHDHDHMEGNGRPNHVDVLFSFYH